MVTTLVDLIGDVSDAIGTDFDPRRTKAYVRHNTSIVVTDDGFRLGGGTVNVNTDGTFTLPDVVAATTLVENLQATVYIDYADPSTRQRVTATLGPYDLSAETGTVDIRDLEEVQALDPTYASEFMAQAQELLDAQILISGIDDTDSAVAGLIEDELVGPLTNAALAASVEAQVDLRGGTAWATGTAYKRGQVVTNPSGTVVVANVDHTAAASYATDAAKWDVEGDVLFALRPDSGKRPVGQGEIVFNVRDFGATGDGATDDTAAIQAAIDAAKQGDGCFPVVFPSTQNTAGYMFSQLLLNKGQILLGQDGMFSTRLKRISGSTGSAIREKTLAEGGNSAQGINIKGIQVNCNSCVGNGIDLGAQQGGAAGTNWGFNGVIEDVCVLNAVGAGFSLTADAITGRNLSAYFNTDGIVLNGFGGNTWHGVSTSQNTNTEITSSAVGDAWFGLHMEPQGADAVITTASNNKFFGVTAYMKGNVTNLFKITSYGQAMYGVTVDPSVSAYTVTKMVAHTVTPAVDVAATLANGKYLLSVWQDVASAPAYFPSSSNGSVAFVGTGSIVKAAAFGTNVRAMSSSAAVASSDGTILTNGTVTVTLPAASAQDGRVIRVRNAHASLTATVDSAGGTIDGASTATLTSGQKATYQAYGGLWYTV